MVVRVLAVTVPVLVTLASSMLVDTDRVLVSEVLFLLCGSGLGIFVATRFGRTATERQWLKTLFLSAFGVRVVLSLTLYCMFFIFVPESRGIFVEGDPVFYAD